MQVVYQRCCGLDVHKESVTACIAIREEANGFRQEMRRFGTMTEDLLALAEWLRQHGVQQVAMEATGVYWKPVWNLLEEEFDLWLVNARHIKQVPGRKTDQKDSQWIADLLQHGLLRRSLVPARPRRELRELTRTRTKLMEQRTAVANRIQKVLEDANIKLASVASDVLGVSGRAMLEAIMAGCEDPVKLAELSRGRLRVQRERLEKALNGRLRDNHRFLLRLCYQQLEFLESQTQVVEAEIQRRVQWVKSEPEKGCAGTPPASAQEPAGGALVGVEPSSNGAGVSEWEQAVQLWRTITGIDRVTAYNLVAEMGTDPEQFVSARHLASWAGMCPGNNESAGKRRSGRTRKGNLWLRRVLCQAAWAAARSKKTYLGARFRRLTPKIGKKRANLATGHHILKLAYFMLKNKTPYQERGADYQLQRNRQVVVKRALRTLKRVGYTAVLEPLSLAVT